MKTNNLNIKVNSLIIDKSSIIKNQLDLKKIKKKKFLNEFKKSIEDVIKINNDELDYISIDDFMEELSKDKIN